MAAAALPTKDDQHFSELRSCVKVEVDVLGSCPNKPTVSVDVKQHFEFNISGQGRND